MDQTLTDSAISITTADNPQKGKIMNINTDITRSIVTVSEFQKQIAKSGAGNCRNDENNFQYIEVSEANIGNQSLARLTEFNFSKFTDCTFFNINFEGSEWYYTELKNVKFINCKFNRTSFDYSVMTETTFANCFMDSASFDFAAGSIEFNNCHLHGAEFHHTLAALSFKSCSAEAMELNFCPNMNVCAENCDFHRAEFNDTKFIGSMKNCVLFGSDWHCSDVTQIVFTDCKTREINTSGSVGFHTADKEEEEFDFDFEKALEEVLDEN